LHAQALELTPARRLPGVSPETVKEMSNEAASAKLTRHRERGERVLPARQLMRRYCGRSRQKTDGAGG